MTRFPSVCVTSVTIFKFCSKFQKAKVQADRTENDVYLT